MVSKKFSKFARGYLGTSISLSLGSQILSQSQFGSVGQQGAQGLELGSRFLPSIGLIGIGGETVRQSKRLISKNNKRRR